MKKQTVEMRKQTVNTVNTRERGSITPGRAICKHQIQGVFTAQTHYTVPTYICSKVGGVLYSRK